MTETEVGQTEGQRSQPWAWMQTLPGAIADDQPMLDSMIEIAKTQATQAAQMAGYALLGDAEVHTEAGVMAPGHGDPGDDDYQAPMTYAADVAERLGIEGAPILLLRLQWETSPIEAEPDETEG